jgi:hypothetical protein
VAIYHLSIKIISRGKGKPAIAAAAYRAAEKIISEYDGRTRDYSRKGGVVYTEILLPGNAPAAYADRAVLWNAVEKAEKKTATRSSHGRLNCLCPQNCRLIRAYLSSVGMFKSNS